MDCKAPYKLYHIPATTSINNLKKTLKTAYRPFNHSMTPSEYDSIQKHRIQVLKRQTNLSTEIRSLPCQLVLASGQTQESRNIIFRINYIKTTPLNE